MARKPNFDNFIYNEIVWAIETFTTKHGYAPCIRDLCRAVSGVKSGTEMSPSVMSYYLDRLQDKGRVIRDSRISRSIRVVKE